MEVKEIEEVCEDFEVGPTGFLIRRSGGPIFTASAPFYGIALSLREFDSTL